MSWVDIVVGFVYSGLWGLPSAFTSDFMGGKLLG